VSDKMQTAKGRLALYAGFWIALASKLQWQPDDRFPVAATNGTYVWYNLDNINARPMGDVVFIALHEIGHNMLCHLTRMHGSTRDPDIQGLAMDYALDELLIQVAAETPNLKMTVPPDAHVDPDPTNKGLTWEARYEKMLKQAKKDGKKPGDGKGQFDVHLVPMKEDANGNPVPMTEMEVQAMAKDWTLAVQAAAVQAKKHGKLPGFLEEFITELIKPKVDWRTQLAHCMARVTHDESSYRRFNRRHLHRGHYLPGFYNERIGEIAYFADTSGSMDSKEFAAARGAMTDICEELKPERIHFGQCDTRLHSVVELTSDELPFPPFTIYGRGGTDMNPAFEWACQHEHEIEAFILQTDGYIPPVRSENVPNVPVIWLVTTDAVLPAGCDFGTVVRVVL